MSVVKAKSVRSMLLVPAAVVSMVCAGLSSAAPAGANAATAVTTLAGDACVTTARLMTRSSIDAAGRVVDSATAAAGPHSAWATEFVYSVNGNAVAQIIPPAGWRPVTATTQQLRTYGFPARPRAQAALKQWMEIWSHWTHAAPPGMCVTDRSSAATQHTSSNWSGGMAINGTTSTNTYTDATVKWSQPRFTSTCSQRSGYSIWAGLGGWNYNNGAQRLVQDGTDVSSGLNSIYPWYELWQTNDHTTETAWSGGSVSPGDSMYAYVGYKDPAPGVDFQVFDYTKGVSWVAQPGESSGTYDGHPISYFYDGSTADAISEAPTFGSTLGDLRQTSGTYFSYFTPNENAISHYRSWALDQTSAHSAEHEQVTSFDGVHGWTDYWGSCS